MGVRCVGVRRVGVRRVGVRRVAVWCVAVWSVAVWCITIARKVAASVGIAPGRKIPDSTVAKPLRKRTSILAVADAGAREGARACARVHRLFTCIFA